MYVQVNIKMMQTLVIRTNVCTGKYKNDANVSYKN